MSFKDELDEARGRVAALQAAGMSYSEARIREASERREMRRVDALNDEYGPGVRPDVPRSCRRCGRFRCSSKCGGPW